MMMMMISEKYRETDKLCISPRQSQSVHRRHKTVHPLFNRKQETQ